MGKLSLQKVRREPIFLSPQPPTSTPTPSPAQCCAGNRMMGKQVTFARAPDHYQQRWLGMLTQQGGTPTQIALVLTQEGPRPAQRP